MASRPAPSETKPASLTETMGAGSSSVIVTSICAGVPMFAPEIAPSVTVSTSSSSSVASAVITRSRVTLEAPAGSVIDDGKLAKSPGSAVPP